MNQDPSAANTQQTDQNDNTNDNVNVLDENGVEVANFEF